jgi:hypothetical protein
MFNLFKKKNDLSPSIKMTGRTKPRVLRALKEFKEEIDLLLQKGQSEKIKQEWFEIVYEGNWQNNLVTTKGKDSAATYAFSRWSSYYHYGDGEVEPNISDTRLTSLIGYTTSLVALPTGYTRHVIDYSSASIKYTKCWLSSMFTTTKTIKEGGVSSYTVEGSLCTHFLLNSSVTIQAGEYYSPLYEFTFIFTPSTTPLTINSPFITGFTTSAKASIEYLPFLTEPLNSTGNTITYSDLSSWTAYGEEVGIEHLRIETNPSLAGNILYHQILVQAMGSFFGFLFKNTSNDYIVPQYYVVLSTDASDLSFSSSGHIMTSSEIITVTSIPSTKEGASSSLFSYTNGTFSRTWRQVFSGAYGNLNGIRSIAICIKESPYGSTVWRYRSIYRILLDNPVDKEVDRILTLDFTRSLG